MNRKTAAERERINAAKSRLAQGFTSLWLTLLMLLAPCLHAHVGAHWITGFHVSGIGPSTAVHAGGVTAELPESRALVVGPALVRTKLQTDCARAQPGAVALFGPDPAVAATDITLDPAKRARPKYLCAQPQAETVALLAERFNLLALALPPERPQLSRAAGLPVPTAFLPRPPARAPPRTLLH